MIEAEGVEIDGESARLRWAAGVAGEGVDEVHKGETGDEGEADPGVWVVVGFAIVVFVVVGCWGVVTAFVLWVAFLYAVLSCGPSRLWACVGANLDVCQYACLYADW